MQISQRRARHLWLKAQCLDQAMPFGSGSRATRQAIEHLGYVQIDTINVIERCHHHILFTRIPDYRRDHLEELQSREKSVFEYWTHALSYVPTRDLRYYLPAMRRHRQWPDPRFERVEKDQLRKVMSRIRREGPLTIRDIDDDVLVEKDHAWASRKPSKRALQMAFYSGDVTVNARIGMLKSYELTERHFDWDRRPRPASERQVLDYLLDRALTAQGLVSLNSVCYLDAQRKGAVRALIESRVRRRELLAVTVEGDEKEDYWAKPSTMDEPDGLGEPLIRLLSPFDPLVIQRRRLKALFGYEHLFEAYVPKAKRVLGYFALPVLVGDEIVAAIDLKTDRAGKTVAIQKWTWTGGRQARAFKQAIEAELDRFSRFQLA